MKQNKKSFRINILFVLVMLLFLSNCGKKPISEDTSQNGDNQDITNPDDKLITVNVYYNNQIEESYTVQNKEEITYPIPKEMEYYTFIKWEMDTSMEENRIINLIPIYELSVFEYELSYETYGQDLVFQTKEEMALCFIKDFYNFIQPEEELCLFLYGKDAFTNPSIKDGTWQKYLGGSKGSRNCLIYKNDLLIKNNSYFFNHEYYGKKWSALGTYVRNVICSSNKRFGYSYEEYQHGALDFYRYIIDDPSTYLNSYGGSDAFHGLPSFNVEMANSYQYKDTVNLPFVYKADFEGWYLDESFTDGPYSNINMIGNKKLYAKWNTSHEYLIHLMDEEENDIEAYYEFNSMCIINEDQIRLPKLNKENANFLGWYVNGMKVENNFKFNFSCDLTLYAKWNHLGINDLIGLEYGDEPVYYNDSYKAVELYEEYEEVEEGSEELRATWVSSFVKGFSPSSNEATMKQELTRILNQFEELNINCIFFHLRTHNNAFYKTRLAPIKEEYGTYETFEQFDYVPWLIDECHKRGMEFHAWLNPYRIDLDKLGVNATAESVALKYQNYPLNPASKKENILITYDSETKRGAILNPASTEVQDYLVSVIQELMTNYDIDGIHFDDYFYQRLNETYACLDDPDQEEFEAYCKSLSTPIDSNSETNKANWRRNNIDNLIYKIHEAIVKENQIHQRTIQFGISPTGIYRGGDGSIQTGPNINTSGHYNTLFCDTYKWVQKNWIDYILPQVYNSFVNGSASNFADIVEWWNRALEGSKVNLYIGIGSYHINSDYGSWKYEEEIFNQLKYLQTMKNVKGVSLFSSTYISNNIDNNTSNVYSVYQKLKNEYWTHFTKVPDSRL